MNTHTAQAVRPLQALFPLLGTTSAFFALMAVGFVIGSAGMVAMM